MPEPEFRPEAILGVLNERGVRYVLAGGFAAVIHGSPYVTSDLDVVPEASRANLARLSVALRDLGWPGFIQLVTFFLILVVGYIYVWRKGVLDWGPPARLRRQVDRKAA